VGASFGLAQREHGSGAHHPAEHDDRLARLSGTPLGVTPEEVPRRHLRGQDFKGAKPGDLPIENVNGRPTRATLARPD
jgi:hypothetical protein